MDLAGKPFEPGTFVFLEAFGNKPTTIKRLKSGDTNSSRIEGGVLQRNNIYKEQKAYLEAVFAGKAKNWKSLDYVAGWFYKASSYATGHGHTASAFVSTNSICQGQQVGILWPLIFGTGHKIIFAHTSFKWANLAGQNAGVTVVIVGISKNGPNYPKQLFHIGENGKPVATEAQNINAYLVPGKNIVVQKISKPISALPEMTFGNKPVDGGGLLLNTFEAENLGLTKEQCKKNY